MPQHDVTRAFQECLNTTREAKAWIRLLQPTPSLSSEHERARSLVKQTVVQCCREVSLRTREFDIILYGATGFTGQQTVAYFRRHAPIDLRWAIAGRNKQKLAALNAGVSAFAVDSADASGLLQLAGSAKVILSTAGPFVLYSDALVAACVEQQTHYVDITGEVDWVRSLIDRFHTHAEANGKRVIPFCGFDSVPADLGVHMLAQELGQSFTEAKGYFRVRGGKPNCGTIASAEITYASGAAARGRDPFLLSPGFSRPLAAFEADPAGAHFDLDADAWVAPFPMSLIDTRVVRRSSMLSGTDIRYQEYLIFNGRLAASAAATGTALFYKILSTPSLRKLATRLFPPGEGPSEQAMNRSWFECVHLGRTTDGRRAQVTLAGRGDPGNRVTIQCVCESALALICNEEQLPARAGVLTPSTASAPRWSIVSALPV